MIRICMWPDDDWCEARDIEQYGWKSDDYIVIETDSEIIPSYNETCHVKNIQKEQASD